MSIIFSTCALYMNVLYSERALDMSNKTTNIYNSDIPNTSERYWANGGKSLLQLQRTHKEDGAMETTHVMEIEF